MSYSTRIDVEHGDVLHCQRLCPAFAGWSSSLADIGIRVFKVSLVLTESLIL